ncbi:alpha/beta hydrolase [Streptomyces sp. NPDC032198]|uniref:alpha/beta fold hydrolase n=1 Tax=Streptomyces sp. NPDC032198 TaxID=3155127 RepID=UPI0033CE9443
MTETERALARPTYEIRGAGAPVLLLTPAPTGLPDEPDPAGILPPGFQAIVPHPRHTGHGAAPLEPFSYEIAAADQLAVLDELDVRQTQVVAVGTACAQAWRLVQEAPERVRSVVCVEPAGLADSTGHGAFHPAFDEAMRVARASGIAGVLALAERDGDFARNPGAGPFARTLHDRVESRAELIRLSVERYVVLLGRFRDGLWPTGSPYFSVPEEWMRRFPVSLAVVSGSDRPLPGGFAERLCRDVPGARLSGPGTAQVAAFLTEHSASPVHAAS